MRVEARWPGGMWRDWGDEITLAEGARRHAEYFDRPGVVEVRWEGGERVWEIDVVREVVFVTRPLRGDA